MLKTPNESFVKGQSNIEAKLHRDHNSAYYGPTAALLVDPGLKVLKIKETTFSPISFTLPRNSEFFKPFQYHLLRFKEHGILSILAQHHMHLVGGGQTSQEVEVEIDKIKVNQKTHLKL